MKYYTHSGLFHQDETLAYAILKKAGICSSFERLIDLTKIPNDGIVGDIGRVYDPKQLLFDHHQEYLKRDDGYPLATAGLIWNYYGRTLLKDYSYVDQLWKRVDNSFIKFVDAGDTSTDFEVSGKCEAGDLSVYTTFEVIRSLNYHDVKNHQMQAIQFQKAVDFLTYVLESVIERESQILYSMNMFSVYVKEEEDGKLLILDRFLDWKEPVLENYPNALFIIKPSAHPGSEYSMEGIPLDKKTRKLRKEIERSPEFTDFIHNGKWIAGGTKEELINLAKFNILN